LEDIVNEGEVFNVLLLSLSYAPGPGESKYDGTTVFVVDEGLFGFALPP